MHKVSFVFEVSNLLASQKNNCPTHGCFSARGKIIVGKKMSNDSDEDLAKK
jgi:hypothetical protein